MRDSGRVVWEQSLIPVLPRFNLSHLYRDKIYSAVELNLCACCVQSHNWSVGDGGVSVVCDGVLLIFFNVLGIEKMSCKQ